MSNEELAIRIKAGDTALYSALWEQIKGFICTAAYRFYNLYNDRCISCGVDSSDLIQAGYFALVDCVNAYEPETGYKLLSFIKYPLLNRFRETLGMRTAKGRGEPLNSFSTSLDMEISEDGKTFAEEIADQTAGEPFEHAEDSIYNEQLRETLDKVMGKALTEIQRTVLEQRYYQGKTLKETGESHGKTMERIRQIEHAGLRQMRKPQYKRELQPFIISSNKIYGGSFGSFKATQSSNTEIIVELIEKWEQTHHRHTSYGVRVGIIHEAENKAKGDTIHTEESFEDCMKRIDGQAKVKALVWG
jgi:RNA polymerase sigma factor (sigma-70 family)